MENEVKKISVREAADMLRGADNILIICHARPDGDTLGSAIALETMLRRMEKRAYAVCDDSISESLGFITGFRTALPEGTEWHNCMRPNKLPSDFTPGFIITADVASLELSGSYGESFAGRIDLKMDHHEMGESFAAHELIYPGCAACTEVIFDLGLELGTLDRQSARAIYTGMVTDSGSFKFSSVTAQTHERAAALLRLGINHDEISEMLYNSRTQAELAAMSVALNNIRFICNGAIAYTTLSRNEIEERGICKGDTEGINAIPIGVKGVKAGLVIKEDESHGFYKLSIRSGADVAANKICALLGGGGHARAAGAKFEARDMQDAVSLALGAVKEITGLDTSV